MTRKFGSERCVKLFSFLASGLTAISIRVVFSISDLQNDVEAEDFDGAEGEEGEVEAPNSYPVRCSISITKVSFTDQNDAFCF